MYIFEVAQVGNTFRRLWFFEIAPLKFTFNELIFEVHKEQVNKCSKIIQEEMSSVKDSNLHSFSIPLLVDMNVGDNWGDLH